MTHGSVLMEDLRYPIGPFEHSGPVSDRDLARWIDAIQALPEQLRAAIEGLTQQQLDTPYRPGGWSCRQVVHHLADSHLNGFIRFKWALTEDTPTIKAFDEERWADLSDYQLVAIPTSLNLLSHLHARWTTLLRALTSEQLARAFIHPDEGRLELAWTVGMYSWHGRHHLAHITGLIERQGWRG